LITDDDNVLSLDERCLLGADCGAVDKGRRTDNSDGWIEQSEQEPYHNHNEADAAAVALTKH